MIDIDISDLKRLAESLAGAPLRARPLLRSANKKSARHLRDRMRSDAAGIGHAPHFPASITDETKSLRSDITTEVGPDKAMTQGALGNILYFGTSNNAPVLDINAPLDAEGPEFEKAVGEAVKDILR